MAQDVSALLPVLRDMFPTMPDDVLLAALDAHGNDIEGALSTLLEMCADAAGPSETVKAAAASTNSAAATESWRAPHPSIANGTSSAQQGDPNTHQAPPATSANRAASANPRPQRGGQGANGIAKGASRKTWGQIRSDQQNQVHQQQHHQQQHPAAVSLAQPLGLTRDNRSPKYIIPGAASGVRLETADFPDLLPGDTPVAAAGANGSRPPVPLVAQLRAEHSPAGGAGRDAAPSGRSVRRGRGSCHRAHRTLTASSSAGALTDLANGDDSWSTSQLHEQRSLAPLASSAASSPYRPPPTRPSPLATAATPLAYGNQPCAYAQVARLAPQPMRPVGSWARLEGEEGSGGQASGAKDWQEEALDELCRSHGWAGRELVEAVCLALQYDLSEVVAALDELQAASYQDRRTGGSVSSSQSASSLEDDEELEDRPAGASGSRATAAAIDSHDFTAQAGFPREPGAGAGGRRGGGVGGGGIDGEDAYSRHRRKALKLTHSWRKRMSKASAAFSSGDRALGRRLVAEAQELRQHAAHEHRQAAERIEEEMNRGRQLPEWELDLHGLHAEEAVEALARRIAALEARASTAPTAAFDSKPPPSRIGSKAAEGSAVHRKHSGPVGQPGIAATAAAVAGAAAGGAVPSQRRELRVIVGKGLHSPGGEASLPRLVAAYLLERGYRFTAHAGQIEVQLRRHYAVNAAAAAPTGSAAANQRPR